MVFPVRAAFVVEVRDVRDRRGIDAPSVAVNVERDIGRIERQIPPGDADRISGNAIRDDAAPRDLAAEPLHVVARRRTREHAVGEVSAARNSAFHDGRARLPDKTPDRGKARALQRRSFPHPHRPSPARRRPKHEGALLHDDFACRARARILQPHHAAPALDDGAWAFERRAHEKRMPPDHAHRACEADRRGAPYAARLEGGDRPARENDLVRAPPRVVRVEPEAGRSERERAAVAKLEALLVPYGALREKPLGIHPLPGAGADDDAVRQLVSKPDHGVRVDDRLRRTARKRLLVSPVVLDFGAVAGRRTAVSRAARNRSCERQWREGCPEGRHVSGGNPS